VLFSSIGLGLGLGLDLVFAWLVVSIYTTLRCHCSLPRQSAARTLASGSNNKQSAFVLLSVLRTLQRNWMRDHSDHSITWYHYRACATRRTYITSALADSERPVYGLWSRVDRAAGAPLRAFPAMPVLQRFGASDALYHQHRYYRKEFCGNNNINDHDHNH